MQPVHDGHGTDVSHGSRSDRSPRAARPACENLETRMLLSTSSTVFSRFGTIGRPGQAVTVDLPLDAERLQAARSGVTLFDIQVGPDTGSRLNLGTVRIARGHGASVLRALSRSGDLLIALRPGDYELTVRGRGASTGAFVVSVHLVGDVTGNGAVQPNDVALIRSGSPGPARAQAVQLARLNLGADTMEPAITFHVVNDTKPKDNPNAPPAYPSSQIYVAITGQNAATGQFVHLDRNGNAVPMELSDNTAPNHLTKNGIDYSNYFVTLDQVASGWDVPYDLTGARLWVGLGSPLYFQVNTDVNGHIGYTTPDLGNATDPNINLYWDHIEFATVNNGINANTTQVDQFGIPQLMTLKANGMPDQTVGINASRSALLAAYQQSVSSDFQPLFTAQAPYRVIAPKHGVFSQSKNPTYFDSYINQVWTHFQSTTWTFTNVLGTFSGTVDPATNVLNLTKVGVPNVLYHVNKPQTWEIFAAAGNMKAGNREEQAVEAQIVAGITRHVALDNPAINVAPFSPSVVSTFYQASPANYYAQFWHQHSVSALAYGFDFDDVYGQNSSVTAPRSASPQLTLDVGWN
jgi:hypothetical protein